jgi:hypothetical protein|nr:MAG TPA: hypothetical protein [Caudoviricetes sp.]
MANFNSKDIIVFDQNDFSVVQTEAMTVKIEKGEMVLFIRDFRNKWIKTILAFLLGTTTGFLISAILH